MTDAILGTKTTLKGLDGEVALEIKPGIQSAEVITIKDRGITHLRGSGRGDLRIGIQVVTPTKLSGKEQELIKQLAGARKVQPPHFSQFQQGLFTKLRERFMGM
jgi:molecular chaperone DnaJ